MAPECLRNESYTQATDIYSFGMIMYFKATGKQPFNNRAHDYDLTLEICEGIRPEINEREVPKCYIELMKRCWKSNPDNRPNAIEIHELIESFYHLYDPSQKEHSQAIYTSRLHNSFTKIDNKSECHDFKIKD
ncbi:kinase-like domain-containing protein [Rhizophagus diaphanus]|nr:kinase-like domain-containing protein [Rhizophagus diaphanus] [Rhizophagus sp. MUCL 43196]